MTIAFATGGTTALSRPYAPTRRAPLSRRTAVALAIAAAFHAAVGFGVWNAKFRPHYDEPPAADLINTELVRPPPPSPPPPPKREVHRAPPRPATPQASPPRMLQPRPPRAVADIAPPQVLPIPPSPAAAAPPALPALAAALPPPAAALPDPVHVITNPEWLSTPNGDDLARYYPDRAQRNGVQGKATLNCAVNEGGNLVDCRVASEAPGDQGFGGAAMKMAGEFRMRPQTRDGVPVAGARVSIPIKFVLPDA